MSLLQPVRPAIYRAIPVKKDIPSHLRCASCNGLVYDSYQTPHGCRLCQSCVDEKLDSTELKHCPGKTEACKDEEDMTLILIKRDSCTPDLASRREVGRLDVKCPNEKCNDTCKWRELSAHLDICEYGMDRCSACGTEVLKKSMDDHKKNVCPRRQITCSLCKQNIIASEENTSHRDLQSPNCCSHYSAPCPFGCGTPNLKVKDFPAHKEVCSERPMNCKFSHWGCSYSNSRRKLEEHYRDSVDDHLTLMDAKLKALGPSSSTSSSATVTMPAAAAGAAVSDDVNHVKTELNGKILNIHDHFKKLQINVANWAHTTMELESMAQKFGGIAQLRTFLKTVEEKTRGLDSNRPAGSSVPMAEASSDQRFVDINNRFLNLESTNYEGNLTWRIAEYALRRREAKETRNNCLFSQPFFSKRYGYMFRAQMYLNGDSSCEGSYLSVFLLLMKSDYDDILEWPCVADVTFKLFDIKDGSGHITKKVKLEGSRPATEKDLSVHCGDSKFLKLSQLDSSDKFVKNDCFYLEVDVDLFPKRKRR